MARKSSRASIGDRADFPREPYGSDAPLEGSWIDGRGLDNLESRTVEKDFVQVVLALDPGVRFAGIIDAEGELVEGGMRSGLAPLEPTKRDEAKLYLKWFLMEAMTDEWNRFLGKKMLFYARYEKVDMYGVPLKGLRIMLVSTERTGSSSYFGDKLLELVDSSKL